MPKARALSIATILEIVAAVALGVPVIRYALAFQAAEPPLNVWGWQMDVSPITGLLFGLTYEGAVYLGIREAFRARRDGLKRWWVPLPCVGLQILAGIAIIAPIVEATQSHQELSAVLGAWSWPWSITLTGATALTLVSLAVTRALRKDAPEGTKGTTHVTTQKTQATPATTAPQKGNGKLPYACPYCGSTTDSTGAPFRNSGSVAAHVRHHCQHRPVPVAVAEA